MMMCLGVDLFRFILFGTLCFLDLYVCFLYQVREGFWFSISCSLSSPSGTPMMQILVCLKLSQRLLTLSLFIYLFWILCSDWAFFASLYSNLMVCFLASSTLLLIPCKLFFISVSAALISDWSFLHA
uniref:Uncharacterized protein n=1 Tax=Molossus molossus TaxID=27622 RepID=A0A7J8FYP5_MOLMO|nr:hypothetical protein HJG59_008233 [Molossus molossus]